MTGAVEAERERIAAALDQAAGFYDHPEIWPEDSMHPEAVAARAMRHAYRAAARMIRGRMLPGDDAEPQDGPRGDTADSGSAASADRESVPANSPHTDQRPDSAPQDVTSGPQAADSCRT